MSKIKFEDGIPERPDITQPIPDEYKTETCNGCVRCRDGTPKKPGWHCTMQGPDIVISPENNACKNFWNKKRQEELRTLHELDVENRRKELWAIYAKKEPVKLPIVHDGYGYIPQCPICGEMPYSMEQCHWCGQRFIRDKKIKEYEKPLTENGTCPNCGAEITIHISRYNGHKSYHCEKCGSTIMQ